ncbi:MAG: NADH-ubiquinone oxidoreductase-F iron-sulfur binding region domain-containing protein [Ilumatobacteraceae bacterium]
MIATSTPPPPPPELAGPTLPRLLTSVGKGQSQQAVPLAQHRRTYPPPPAPRRKPIESYIAAIETAGLRGRGGASFPTGRKLRTVSQGHTRPVVCVNGSEGEPASRKDGLLMTRTPHLVLDGALLAAAAVGAIEVIVCIERANHQAISAVERAIHERVQSGEQMLPVYVMDLPAKYVAGEETALVHFVNGGEAKPTMTPPRPFEKGVGGRPTLIDNVETLCHLAQIIRWGPAWFRGQGTADEPGTVLLTLSGAVKNKGVCEMPIGRSMDTVLSWAKPTGEVGAVLLGGYYGTWVSAADSRRVTMDNAALRSIGSSLGCGALVVLPSDACGLRETARVLKWLAGETAGQCGPCVHGLAAIAGGMNELAVGRATNHTVEMLNRWAGQVDKRGACSFPDGAVRLLRSALQVFGADVHHHIAHGPCWGARRSPVLAIPTAKAEPWR